MLERSLCWWWPRLYCSLELSPHLQNKISGLFLPRLATLHMHNTELGISHKPVLSFVFCILYSLSPVVSLPDGSLRIILNFLIFCPPTQLPISNNLWSPVTTFQSCCALYSPSSSAGLDLSIHFFFQFSWYHFFQTSLSQCSFLGTPPQVWNEMLTTYCESSLCDPWICFHILPINVSLFMSTIILMVHHIIMLALSPW